MQMNYSRGNANYRMQRPRSLAGGDYQTCIQMIRVTRSVIVVRIVILSVILFPYLSYIYRVLALYLCFVAALRLHLNLMLILTCLPRVLFAKAVIVVG